jgi:hypothetical protein
MNAPSPGLGRGPVVAFEITLQPGAIADDGLVMISNIIAAMGNHIAETMTVTDVARTRAALITAQADAALLRGLLRELLHIADNGFMAPEVRRAEIARIALAAASVTGPQAGDQQGPGTEA